MIMIIEPSKLGSGKQKTNYSFRHLSKLTVIHVLFRRGEKLTAEKRLTTERIFRPKTKGLSGFCNVADVYERSFPPLASALEQSICV
jgi:hypothetical protein